MPDALHGDTVPASSVCVFVCVLLCRCWTVCYLGPLCTTVNSCFKCALIYASYNICVVVFIVNFGFQGEPHRARCEHEKAAGGGPEDETEVPAGDGEQLPWTGGGSGEKGQ